MAWEDGDVEYNGWENYETYSVGSTIDNDERLYCKFYDAARRVYKRFPTSAKKRMANYLQREVIMLHRIGERFGDITNLKQFTRVRWQEIADMIVECIREEADAAEKGGQAA